MLCISCQRQQHPSSGLENFKLVPMCFSAGTTGHGELQGELASIDWSGAARHHLNSVFVEGTSKSDIYAILTKTGLTELELGLLT